MMRAHLPPSLIVVQLVDLKSSASVFFSSDFITAKMSAFSDRRMCCVAGGVVQPGFSVELEAALALVLDDPLYLYLHRFVAIDPYTHGHLISEIHSQQISQSFVM